MTRLVTFLKDSLLYVGTGCVIGGALCVGVAGGIALLLVLTGRQG